MRSAEKKKKSKERAEADSALDHFKVVNEETDSVSDSSRISKRKKKRKVKKRGKSSAALGHDIINIETKNRRKMTSIGASLEFGKEMTRPMKRDSTLSVVTEKVFANQLTAIKRRISSKLVEQGNFGSIGLERIKPR